MIEEILEKLGEDIRRIRKEREIRQDMADALDILKHEPIWQ